MQNLRIQLEKLCADFDGKATIAVQDLQTGDSLGINSEEQYHVASVIKMWLLWLFFMEEQQGKRDLQQKIQLHCADGVINMGVTDLMHKEIEWTYQDLLYLMVILSDNHATNHLIDTLTLEKVNAEIQRLGAKGTQFNKKMNAGMANWSTADDVVSIFRDIFQSKELSEKNRELALDMLLNQRYNTKLPLFFNKKMQSDATLFYHKTGEIALAEVDAGVLRMTKTGKDVVIVCMTKDLKDNLDGIRFQNKVGELVYAYYNV